MVETPDEPGERHRSLPLFDVTHLPTASGDGGSAIMVAQGVQAPDALNALYLSIPGAFGAQLDSAALFAADKRYARECGCSFFVAFDGRPAGAQVRTAEVRHERCDHHSISDGQDWTGHLTVLPHDRNAT
jgi:hypothetical protein